MKKIVYAALLLLSALVSCTKEFRYDGALTLSGQKNVLSSKAGSTPVIVYANDAWKATLPSDCTWARLDSVSGSGLGEFIFRYDANEGIARSVTVTVWGVDGLSSSIEMVQKSGADALTLSFPYSTISVARSSGKAEIPFTTNIPEEEMASAVLSVSTKTGAAVDWVDDLTLFSDRISFKLARNESAQSREAVIRFAYTDAVGTAVSSGVTVTQTAAAAYINFSSALTGIKYMHRESSLNLPFSTNLGLFLGDIFRNAASSQDWAVVEGGDETENQIRVSIAANSGSSDRISRITLSYTDDSGESTAGEYLLVQKPYVKPYSIADLKALITAESGTLTLSSEGLLSGVAVSDCIWPNVATNPNTATNAIDFTLNWRTAYLTSEDGASGVRVVFDNASDNIITRGDKVYVDINGLTLTKESSPCRYTLSGLKTASISVDETKSDVIVREKTLAQLTDSDIYTCVRLKRLEFSFKTSAYTNTNDGYYRKLASPTYVTPAGLGINPKGAGTGYCFADDSPCCLNDETGRVVYAVFNNEVPWRRYGNGVPQGTCDITGIITHENMPRWAYKGDMGDYQIRIQEEKDIETVGEAFSKPIVEWHWKLGDGVKTREEMVTPTWPSPAPSFYGISSNLDGLSGVTFKGDCVNFNDLSNAETKGQVTNGIISWVKTGLYWASDDTSDPEAAPWFCFSFSTAGLSGTNLTFNWMPGQGSSRGSATNVFAPALWKVEYSTDGVNFTAIDKIYAIHAVCWNQTYLPLFSVTGQHLYSTALPSSLLGQDKVYVRVRAASSTAMMSDFSAEEGGSLKSSDNRVRFGDVSIRYN